MRRVDQPRPPGTPVGLGEQIAPNADAPARSVPPAHPATERPSGMLGGLTRYVPGDGSGRPSATPAAAETSRRPTTSAPPLPYGGSGSAARMNEAAGHPSRTPQLPQLSEIERARFHFATTDSQHLRPVRPLTPPTVGASSLRRSPAIRPYRDVLSQWQRHYSADRNHWHSAWRQANSNNPQIETRTYRALKATADLLEEATGLGQLTLELRSVPLPQFPDQAFRLSHLQHMTIDAAGLMEFPDAVQFADLETLTLARNPIRSLPASIASLSRLRKLSIHACPELTELPEHLVSTDASGEHQGLVNLQSLRLERTGIRSLPASIANLQNLKRLQVRNSPLSTLGPAIHRLPKLEELDLQGCTALRNYPPIFGGSAPLKRLILKDCSNLLTLPLDIHRLTQLEKLDLRGCVNLSRLPSLIAQLPANCIILVPPHLQAQLERLRTVALERIEDTAQTMLSTVIDEERNPFLEGAPSYIPENRPPDTPTTFGEIPALQKMVQESRDRHFLQRVHDMAGPSPTVEDLSEEGLSRHYTNVSNWKAQQSAHLGIVDHLGQFVYHEGSQLDAATLAKAVQMWKTRELIVNAHPQDRARFPAFTLHIPEQVSDDSDDEQQTGPEPSGHQ